MEKYIEQLLADIIYATNNVSWPFVEKELELHDWISDEKEDKIAPVRKLEDWTGISKEMLPPENMLSDQQVSLLLEALAKMLDEYNWSFILEFDVPERIQYNALRDNFNQEAKVKQWHRGFFALCRPGTEMGKCGLGEFCQCAFFKEFFSEFVDENLSPEEERERQLEIEIIHLKKKHGDKWMKYYPYYLDKNYDDDERSSNYDFGDEEDNNDDWWR